MRDIDKQIYKSQTTNISLLINYKYKYSHLTISRIWFLQATK